MTTTTPTSGAAIQRYKIGYHADECGQRSSTPSGIPDASGSWVRYADHVTALAAGQATAAQQPDSENLRSMIEGMSVSVDVSTGDHDASHRYFGTVTEVMECQGNKHGVTLLVQDAEPNFTATPTAPSTPSSTAQQAPRDAERELEMAQQFNAGRQYEAVRIAARVAAAPAGATEMENLQRTAVGWQERALRAERNWVVCRRWAIAGGAPVEKLGDDPDQPFHAASPAIEGESNV